MEIFLLHKTIHKQKLYIFRNMHKPNIMCFQKFCVRVGDLKTRSNSNPVENNTPSFRRMIFQKKINCTLSGLKLVTPHNLS